MNLAALDVRPGAYRATELWTGDSFRVRDRLRAEVPGADVAGFGSTDAEAIETRVQSVVLQRERGQGVPLEPAVSIAALSARCHGLISDL